MSVPTKNVAHLAVRYVRKECCEKLEKHLVEMILREEGRASNHKLS